MRAARTVCALPLFAVMSVAAAEAADCKAVPAPSVDWQDCNKSKIMLSGSSLEGAILVSTDLSYTDLRSSKLAGANFEKATLFRASLEGSHADKANFARIEGYRTVFSAVSAQGASFASAELQRSDFTGANLTGADFQKAELGRAVLVDAVITGGKFPMANLSRVQLNKAKFEGGIDLTGAFLFLTRIEGLDLSQATGLQQWQIDQACGDGNTKLPADLKPASDWPCAAPE
jgi:uncharacterized protein YjbI with pentapeptide repeats